MPMKNFDKQRIADVRGELDAQAVYRQIRQCNAFADFARSFAFSPDPMVARNALWCLTKANPPELRQLQPLLDEFINHAIATEHSSVRRLSLNIVERLQLDKDSLRTDFLDFCLQHMAQLDEPPGVQAVCMKLAHRMCAFYPELRQEFTHTLLAMDQSYYKPAVKCVINRILKEKLKPVND